MTSVGCGSRRASAKLAAMKTLPCFVGLVAVLALGWSLACYHASHGRSLVCPIDGSTVAPLNRPAARPPANPPAPSVPASAQPAPRGLSPAERGIAAAVDQLTSKSLSFAERRKLWDALRDSGQLDSVTALLKRMAAENPEDAAVSLALGEAEIRELRAVAQSGGNFNEQGILALQADSDFAAALAQDPTNWEAQFEKAAALAHWPASLNKAPEVISLLSSLVTQQENLPPQPEFAESYLILGQEYQATGQPDKALQIWQQGAARFPINPNLQQLVATSGR